MLFIFFFLLFADFFQYQLFWKILSEIPFECQTVWILIRPNILLGLIRIQAVCKAYQQTTPVGQELGPFLSRRPSAISSHTCR